MLLSIDTCGATGTVALGRREGDTINPVAQTELAGKTFAAQLVPQMRSLLSANAATPHDVAAIIVVNGPGSFTGVRIGVSAAKGLAEALRVPVIALSRLALLARKGQESAAALDAGRGEFYFGFHAEGRWEERLLTAEQIRERGDSDFAVCEGAVAAAWPSAHMVLAPDASDALLAAGPRLRARDFDDVSMLDGNYVRRTPAELFARPPAGAK
jgi:tRNA threonylcarbamoyladenosine biosynthesis protein TsaB